jgi:hypothetical protein
MDCSSSQGQADARNRAAVSPLIGSARDDSVILSCGPVHIEPLSPAEKRGIELERTASRPRVH